MILVGKMICLRMHESRSGHPDVFSIFDICHLSSSDADVTSVRGKLTTTGRKLYGWNNTCANVIAKMSGAQFNKIN